MQVFTVRSSIILFACILVSNVAPAQHTYTLDQTTRFDKIGIKEGLSTDWTQCIHQDKFGFIWIGTKTGLNMYDGYTVRNFLADRKNPYTINNDFIRSIFEEPDGILWFCMRYGISRYNRENHTFSNFLQNTLNSNNKNYSTQKIVSDSDYFWVDAWNDLLRFDKQSGTFKTFGRDSLNPERGIKYISSDYIFIDRSGVLWAGSSDGKGNSAFSRFNKNTETFTHFEYDSAKAESFGVKEVTSMIEDRDGRLWITTDGGGLLEVINRENGKLR